MAVVSIGSPIFRGTEEEDVGIFIDLFIGYIHSININPLDRAANPSGASRTMGILRGCMQGAAAAWFDRELTGKNWKISYIRKQGTAVMNAFRQLIVPEGVNGPNANTYVPNTTAAIYAAAAANAAVLIGDAFIPDGRLKGGDELWKRSGGKPTTDAPNILQNAVNGNGSPIVLPGILPDQAFYWLRTQFTTILLEKHRMRFTTISQNNLPIIEYYQKIVNSAKLLGFGNEIIQDQFYRGLDPDNILEVERIGIDRPIDELVTTLDRIEKRKAEMHLGLAKRIAQKDHYNRLSSSTPSIKDPPVSQQEAIEIKPIASHAVTQDMINNLLKSHTENLTNSFQAQIKALQNTISQSQTQSPKKVPPPVRPKDWDQITDYIEYKEKPFDGDNLTGRDYLKMMYGDDIKITGPEPPPKSKNVILAAKALARAQRAKEDRQVDRLAQLLEDKLDLNDDPMDITNLIDSEEIILQDADGNEFTAYVTRGKGLKKKMRSRL